MLLGPWPSQNRKTLSMTLSSVDVVSRPVTANQSLTTMPPPTTLLPRLTDPATSGTCSRLLSSSWSWMGVLGCTSQPLLDSAMYDPTSTLSAMVCRNTSTPSTSAMISSVSRSTSGCISA